jgi:hypothetical protein
VFAKLGIVESPESSRRVLAVLAYLQGLNGAGRLPHVPGS